MAMRVLPVQMPEWNGERGPRVLVQTQRRVRLEGVVVESRRGGGGGEAGRMG